MHIATLSVIGAMAVVLAGSFWCVTWHFRSAETAFAASSLRLAVAVFNRLGVLKNHFDFRLPAQLMLGLRAA